MRVSGNKIPLLDTLFEVYVAKRRKKDNGKVEEIETPEERKEATKEPVHKKKKVIAKKRKTKPVEHLIISNIQPYFIMTDLQNKKADITYAQLFQVAPNIRKEMNKITSIGRITTMKVVEFCLKQDKEEKTTSMYCEAQVKGCPILLILDSGSSGCVVAANFLKELDIPINHSLIVVMVRVYRKQKRPLEKEESEGELDMLEEKTVTEINESDSSKEYKDKNLVDQLYLYWEFQKNEGKSVWCGKCLKEEKKEEGFKLGRMTGKQETRLRAILTKYKSTFKEESEQLERTSITQYEIYAEDGPLIKQKFYPTSKPEHEFIKAEIQCMEKAILVKKKNRSMRFCVDYRKLNKAHKCSGYLPMVNGPSATGCIEKFALEYIDDLNKGKYYFGQQRITFLDHEIFQQGIVRREVKVKAMKEFLLPKNLRALRGFLELARKHKNKFQKMDKEKYRLLVRYLTNLTIIAELTKSNYGSSSLKPKSTNPLRVIQQQEVQIVLNAVHKSAIDRHLGEKATLQKQRGKPTIHEPLYPINPTQLFDRIGIDFVSPLPKTKKGIAMYSTEVINEEEVPSVILTRIVTFIDHLQESRAMALENIKKSQEKQRAKLDTQKGGKLELKWLDPYWIHKSFNNRTYKLQTLEGK
ncbi:13134_t:CDS:10, partial [Gigaspora margarita]